MEESVLVENFFFKPLIDWRLFIFQLAQQSMSMYPANMRNLREVKGKTAIWR